VTHGSAVRSTAARARPASSLAASLAVTASVALALAGCAGGGPKMTAVEKAGNIKDTTMSRQQLEDMSNAYADRYFTLMLAASERVMRDNPDINQRRLMNGLRLLGVSSMYDISTSSDSLTQLLDQLGVVTLQNYYWVDSGRAQVVWGDRAVFIVQNLRKAREDIWDIASKVFTQEQIDDIDLLISNWWYSSGGTEFVAYVRFSDIATRKGKGIIEEVRSGGGLLEPLDKATEQFEEANFAAQRAFFWAKRVPLFANWQALALVYEFMVMPEVQTALADANRLVRTIEEFPEGIDAKGTMARQLIADVRGTMTDAGTLLDKVAPIMQTVQGITTESGTALTRVNEALATVNAMQERAAASAAPSQPTEPVKLEEYGALLEQVRQNLVEANSLLGSANTLTDQEQLAGRLKPIEGLIQMRIHEVQQATTEVINGVFIRLGILLAVLVAALAIFMRRRAAARS
jgi:uncharacterized protein YoxC